jgi:hypothetical protein
MGDPGVNKSTFNYWIAGQVTRGTPLPGSLSALPASSVILFQAEDRRENIINHLEAAGADLDRVRIITDSDFELSESIAELEKLVIEVGAKLIVIDPLTAYVDSSQREAKLRKTVLAPLAEIAARTDCAMVTVRHLRKSGGKLMHRGLGSMAISAAVRSAFVMFKDPNDHERRILLHYKSSLAAHAPSLLFEKEKRLEGLNFKYLGESHYSTRDFESDGDHEATALEEAKNFLVSVLSDEKKMSFKELQKQARDSGVSERTLKRAKRELGVLSVREGFGRGSIVSWVLGKSEAVEGYRRIELDQLADQLFHGSPSDGLISPPIEPTTFPVQPSTPGYSSLGNEDGENYDEIDDSDEDDDFDEADWWKKR